MSTNYYLYKNICPCCGKGKDKLHIGKSAVGWCFALHIDNLYCSDHNSEFPRSFKEWKTLFTDPHNKIFDEYEREVHYLTMIDIITDRKGRKEPPNEKFCLENQCEVGPRNLARCKKNQYCIGNGGEETYDYCVGEFS
jgi:hypothetical protein